jgi:hypothetical protein
MREDGSSRPNQLKSMRCSERSRRRRSLMDELRKNLVERLGLAEDRADAAIHEVLAYLIEHLPAPAAEVVANFASSPEDPDGEQTKKVTTAAVAATTAAVNVVVLPGAH